jgi:hypothetical protein
MSIAAKMESLLQQGQNLTEADSIDPSELPPKVLKAAEGLGKYGFKITTAFEGVHGNVVSLKASGGIKGLAMRLSAEELKAITAVPGFRWLEADGGEITIGC